MSVQGRQSLRLIKFVAELKKNSYPNAGSFAKILRIADINENLPCSCSARTVMRDIETLQNEYNAPIAYDAANRGYYLKNPSWELNVPILDDDILSMALLGTRLAADILPEPIKTDVNNAIEKSLTCNNSEFFDEAMIESLLCATGIKAVVNPVIFKNVFDGWRLHKVLALNYRKPNGEESKRLFEPHIIAFHKGIWYVKGYEYRTKKIKTYAMQRITEAAFEENVFKTDKKLLEETRRNGLFEYPRIDGVRLHCDESIAFYLYEHQKSKKFKIEPQDDGSLIVTLKPAFEHDVIRWVLGESGQIVVLDPPELRAKVASAAKQTWELNS